MRADQSSRYATNTRNQGIARRRQRRGRTNVIELLEPRRLLCAEHLAHNEVIEERPDLIGAGAPEVEEPANIVWVNRGQASDGFAARFGTLAPTARAVVDAVIDYYELTIGSFNYPTAGQTYNLTVSMGASGGGFGASAGLATSLGGKPKSGSITMGAGNGSADPNDANGWFIDPTPYDNSEFMGNIVNAFAGDAQAGSPAAGKGDFFTVVGLEMTHCMGLMGSTLSGWSSKTTNTGIADTAEGGGVGTFYVFQGPSIKHLLTSNNGGSGGSNWGSAIHGAGPGVSVNFGGNTYIGAQDVGNAVYEFGRRYMVNNAFSLMFKDAYGFSSINPAKFGTFYSSPFSSTGVVTVRGGAGTSADNVQIFRSAGNTLTISVNIGNDIPGTGALPGAGDLPAFTSVYDMSQVSSIVIDTGGGDDFIAIDTTNFSANITQPISINAGAGNDSLALTFFGGNLDFLRGAITFNGGTGSDDIVVYDNAATFNDTYTITSTSLTRQIFGGLTYSATEALFLNGQSGNNVFNINSTAAGMSVHVDGRAGNDTFRLGAGNIDGNLLGPVNVTGGGGSDILEFNNTLDATLENQTLAAPNFIDGQTHSFTGVQVRIFAGPGGGTVNMNQVIGLTVFNGGSGNDTVNIGGGIIDTNLGGQVNVTGNGGFDSVVIDDQLDTGNDTYRFLGSDVFQKSFAGGGNSSLIIVSVESQTLRANNGANLITVDDYTIPLRLFANGGDDTVNVLDGTVTLNTGSGADSLTVNGDFGTSGDLPATVILDTDDDLTHLNVATGGTLRISGGAVLAKAVGTFSVAGVIDMAGGAIITRAGGPSPALLRDLCISGRNNGAWNGTGPGGAVNSSLAAGTLFSDGVGSALSSEVAVSSIGSFTINPGDSLLRYTRNGDANLDGVVNLADFNRLAGNFGGSNKTWAQGDANYDGLVNLADFNVLAGNFGNSVAPDSQGRSSNPEDLDALRDRLLELA